jgi:glutamate-ammonia-ligase adenylyltransferase
MEMITPLVYRPVVSEEFIHAVRANKRRIEQKCALEGETETNVKTGYGGIRDIEFIVQLFQLELGGMHSQVRSANTLSGIQRLRHLSVLTRSEARELSQDYQYLRTLEHRLQLLHGSQTQTMPAAQDDQERTFLAMRMGFSDRGAFEADLAARRHRVRHYLDRLFYGERRPSEHASLSASADWSDVGDLLDNQHSQAAEDQLASRLAAAGFMDVPAALRALRLPMSGNEFGGMPPDTPEEFKTIAPRLLALLAASAQPDQALAGLEALALAVPNRAQLYASMDDSPEIMDRLVALAAASPPLMRLLTQHLEWMESIVGDEDEDEQEQLQGVTPGQNSHVEGLGERLRAARGREQKLEALARYYLRERLRIGARDAWDRDAPVETMTALTRLAEAVLSALMAMEAEALIATEAAPELAREALPHVSAVGLGKLGGAELGYASDWDLVFVYDEGDGRTDGRGEHRSALAQRLVESIHSAARLIGTYGADIELDLRLRPWGKKGALALTPSAYREYLDAAGETWERQAGLKARYVAGDESPGRRMEEIFRAASVGRAATPEELAEIVAMKRRIERERLNAAEQETDLKLGFGGMSDVEWLVQKLQIQHGKSRPSLWETNTLRALRALAAESVLSEQEAIVLEEAYTLLTRLRNGLWLLTGRSEDVLADAAHRRALARRRGYADAEESRAEEQLWATVRAKMGEVRAIFEARFAGE